MSFARKRKRRYDRNDRQCRITCPKCHAKLIEKTEYGLVCMECGWMKLSSMDKSVNTLGEKQYDARGVQS